METTTQLAKQNSEAQSKPSFRCMSVKEMRKHHELNFFSHYFIALQDDMTRAFGEPLEYDPIVVGTCNVYPLAIDGISPVLFCAARPYMVWHEGYEPLRAYVDKGLRHPKLWLVTVMPPESRLFLSDFLGDLGIDDPVKDLPARKKRRLSFLSQLFPVTRKKKASLTTPKDAA